MKRVFAVLLLAMATAWSLPHAVAGDVGRIPTVTRLVHVFYGLEDQLAEAVVKRDHKAVAHLLSDDFEMRVNARLGSPVPRADWIHQSFAEPKLDSSFEQMAVHDYGSVAVVSFLWKVKAVKSGSIRDYSVVDVWRQGAGDPRLAVRYAGPVGAHPASVPGEATPASEFEKRE